MNLPMTVMTDEEVARFGRKPEPGGERGFGALETARGGLPLVAMQIEARNVGVVAAIEVEQTFVNSTGEAIEATYICPLPDRAAVRGFRMRVGARVIDGVVDERGAARERYDDAIAAGHRAAIAEEERGGVFSLRVGNLMPGDVATVSLSLVGPLPVDDGEVTFQFPLVVAPRYIPGVALAGEQAGLGTALDTDLVPDASRISPPVRLPGWTNPVRLGLRVMLTDAQVHDVASSLHAITTSRRDGLLIAIQPGERLDRDFILRFRIDDGAALRSSLVCADDADGGGGTFVLTLVPPSTASVGAKPRDVVFLIDRSGSMDGWKMVAARRAAARLIDTLTSRDRFCAIAFDDRIEAIPGPALVEATDRVRFRAVEALAKIQSRGGTEMAQPLARAVELLRGGYADRERVIVLITDGQVGNEAQIARDIVPQLHATRVFTLGIDQAVNGAFLRRLAAAGGGLCEVVESEDRLDAVMAKVHRRVGAPVATELAIWGEGLELDARSLAPAKLPDVYAGAPVTVYGRYRGRAGAGAAVSVTGTQLGEPLRERVPAVGAGGGELDAPGASGAPGARGGELGTDPDARPAAHASELRAAAAGWLPASWARARIRDLEDSFAAGARGVEGDIVALSKRYGVLSRFTAYLAVDRAQVVNRGGRLNQVVQPVEAPSGWGSLGQAAPAAAPSGMRGGSPGMPPAMPQGTLARARVAMPAPAARSMSPGLVGGRPIAPGAPAARSSGASAMPPASPPPMPMPPASPPPMPVAPADADDFADMDARAGAPSSGGWEREEVTAERVAAPAPRAVAAESAREHARMPQQAPQQAPRSMSLRAPSPISLEEGGAASRGAGGDGAFGGSAGGGGAAGYLAALVTFAEELAAQASGRRDAVVMRMVRQRMVEWVEDVRSVGLHEALAREVERLVERLRAALAGGDVAREVAAIAVELAGLATRATPPPASRPSRPAFWK